MASVRHVKEYLIMNGELYNEKYKDFRYISRSVSTGYMKC